MLSFLEKEDISLLINVNNGSINTSLFSFVKNKKPELLYCVSAPFAGEKPDPLKLSDSMLMLLDSSLKNLVTNVWSKSGWKRQKKISNVMVSFSSPWFLLKTKEIHLTQDTPFIITKKFINDITLKEEEVFKRDLLKNYSETTQNQFSVIEKSVVHTKINGYVMDNVIGRKTKTFDASLLISVISQDIEQKVSDLVLKHTHVPRESIFMHNFPLVLFSAIRDDFEKDPNFILINSDSEITDIILVNDHVIKSIASFPFGKNTIIRYIAKSFKISFEIAESQLSLFMSKKMDDSISRAIQTLLEDLEKEWAIYLEDSLLTLSPKMIFPQKTYMLLNDETAPIFLSFIKIKKMDMTLGFRKNADIIQINNSILSGFYQSKLKTPVPESLIALVIFQDKLIQSQ